VHNLTSASAASLRQSVAELAAQAASLQRRLTDTLAQFDGICSEVQQLEGLVVDEVGGCSKGEISAAAGCPRLVCIIRTALPAAAAAIPPFTLLLMPLRRLACPPCRCVSAWVGCAIDLKSM
jgi:hypothetical protein